MSCAPKSSVTLPRYKIRQVIDCGVIGVEFLEVSLLKLTPAFWFMAKPGPEAGARGDVLQPHVDAGMLLPEPARQDAVDEHPRVVRGLGRHVDALTTRPRRPSKHWILRPPSPKEGTLALGSLQGLTIPVHLVHPGQAILPLKLRRFTEFAASLKSLAADLAELSAPKTSAEKKK